MAPAGRRGSRIALVVRNASGWPVITNLRADPYERASSQSGMYIRWYPGQIFTGTVVAIWQGSGAGQMLPSGQLPAFTYQPTEIPQGQFAVAIRLDGADQSKFPIGAQGRAAIYTNPSSGFVALRKIGIRAYSWLNFIYPFSG